MRKTAVLFCVLTFAAGAAGAANLSASAIEVGMPADVIYQQQQVRQLHSRLMEQQVELGVSNSLVVNLTEEQRKSIYSAVNQLPMRVGVVAPVAAAVRLDDRVSKDATVQSYGAIQLIGHTMTWTTSVIAEGATGIRLFITNLDLPEDAELAIYNKHGEAFAYTGRGPFDSGDFWTHTMTGSTAYLQLTGADITNVSFDIADLGYLGDKWAVAAKKKPAPSGDSNLCTYNADCVENAGCTSSSVVTNATKAVAHMQFVDGQYLYICSGGLIANDAGLPYFLTANHCMSTNTVASTLEAYFFYEIGCDDACLPQWTAPDTPRTLGATVEATNETGDYTLLRLGDPAPAGTVMLGWNATPIATANGTMLYRIAHPLGAPQAYSTHSIDTTFGSCSSWPIGSWVYSQDVIGATQGGSSGSPVLNTNGEIVGQLSGACGMNLNDECDEINNRTVDGAFASYYSQIAGLLGAACVPSTEICDNGADEDCDGLVDGDDPDCAQPCTDADGDGYCVEDDCDDGNFFVNPGEDEICDDLLDNDCDGDIDDDDSDCGTSCLPRGDPCSTGAECCSGSCHPRKLTCK